MSFKLLKAGSYTYKRQGKFKTAYKVRYRNGGVYLEKPILNPTDDKDALRIARKMILDAEKDAKAELNAGALPALVRFETVAAEVVASKVKPSTRKTTQWYMDIVCPWFNAHCPYISDFKESTWEDFVFWFQTARPGQKLFNPRKGVVMVIHRAKKRRLLTGEFELKNPDPRRAAGKVYSEDEIQRLFEKARPELRLQILMALTLGMRRSEILKLRWERINWSRQTIALKAEDTKIKQGREFRVNAGVWELLKARSEKITSPYVFPSSRDKQRPMLDNKTAWQACKRAAQVTGRFHDLRHTFLTVEISRKKHQAMDVCIYAGLSLEELRQTYLHPDYQDTAYIADSQGEKVGALLSIRTTLGQNLGKENKSARYA